MPEVSELEFTLLELAAFFSFDLSTLLGPRAEAAFNRTLPRASPVEWQAAVESCVSQGLLETERRPWAEPDEAGIRREMVLLRVTPTGGRFWEACRGYDWRRYVEVRRRSRGDDCRDCGFVLAGISASAVLSEYRQQFAQLPSNAVITTTRVRRVHAWRPAYWKEPVPAFVLAAHLAYVRLR